MTFICIFWFFFCGIQNSCCVWLPARLKLHPLRNNTKGESKNFLYWVQRRVHKNFDAYKEWITPSTHQRPTTRFTSVRENSKPFILSKLFWIADQFLLPPYLAIMWNYLVFILLSIFKDLWKKCNLHLMI